VHGLDADSLGQNYVASKVSPGAVRGAPQAMQEPAMIRVPRQASERARWLRQEPPMSRWWRAACAKAVT